jgi:hypothetical protein
MSLQEAIRSDNWIEVRRILQTERGISQVLHEEYIHEEAGDIQMVTALHLACTRDCPQDVLSKLLEIRPSAVHVPSLPSEKLPLHFVVRRSCQHRHRHRKKHYMTAIRLMLEVDSSIVKKKAWELNGSFTPLHLACYLKASCDIILQLRDADLVAARYIMDAQNRTAWEIAKRKCRGPVHCSWRKTVKTILSGEHSDGTTFHNGQKWLGTIPNSVQDMQQKSHLGNSGDLCICCLDAPGDHVMVPCGHTCLCQGCCLKIGIPTMKCKQLMQQRPMYPSYNRIRKSCPICKTEIDFSMKIFMSGVPDLDTASLEETSQGHA